MPKGRNQKAKLLYLYQILREESDENHPLTMADLLEKLARRGVTAERKSVYDDLDILRGEFDLPILKTGSRHCGYYLAEREFQLAELKLLVDAIQSSKFITTKKSEQLIGKLEKFASRHEAGQLQRQVYINNRGKSMNESIYYNVDCIHNAIFQNRQITFLYFRWEITFQGSQRVKKSYRREGRRYQVSPYALIWANENYYLVGQEPGSDTPKHYRVDKMEQIQITGTPREERPELDRLDTALYTRRVFDMFGGETQTVKLRVKNTLTGVIIDRFGTDVFLSPDDDTHFLVTTEVSVSPTFFGWLFSLGDGVQLLSPASAVEHGRQMAEQILTHWKKPK